MHKDYCNAHVIKSELDGQVMGQEKGTRAVAMAIARHLSNSEAREKGNCDDFQTDNVLLIGPTGCGKTETFRVLRKLEQEIQCPIIMVNTLNYSGTGSWRNTVSVKTIFEDVFMRAADIYYDLNGDDAEAWEQQEGITKIANRAIILFDEFDKISLMGEDNGLLYLREYQSTLLKLAEGDTIKVRDMTHTKTVTKYDRKAKCTKTEEVKIDISDNEVDTTHMLFIFMGAFAGIETITRCRLQKERSTQKQEKQQNILLSHVAYQDTRLGFIVTRQSKPEQNEQKEEIYTYEQLIPSQEDVINYGFMRELIGRIPVRTVYKPLTEDALIDILLNCRTSVYREYQRKFKRESHELKCDRAALREVARITISRGTGARGLRGVFAELLQQTEYDLSGDPRNISCLIRGKDIKSGKPPLLHDRTRLIKKKGKRLLNAIKKDVPQDHGQK